MPTLPLMTPSPHADAPRRIAAPGGYEAWRFDASSDDGKLHLIAALHFGHAFNPQYLRRYARYRRRPTRVPPPVPAEYCAVTFALLEKGRPALRFVEAARATLDDFNATGDGRSVRLGASHLSRGGDGVLRVSLRGTYHDRTISANLAFRPQIDANCDVDLAPAPAPTAPSTTTANANANGNAGMHGWVIVSPLCDVDGEISVVAAESGGPPRVTPFAGVGSHDHCFGTRPMGELGDRWLLGRALFEDRAIAFQQAGGHSFVYRWIVKEQPLPPARVSKTTSAALKLIGSGISRWGIGYPETIELPGDVRLMRPRVVASSLASVAVAYDAVGDLETGRALVQVFKPRRPRWSPW